MVSGLSAALKDDFESIKPDEFYSAEKLEQLRNYQGYNAAQPFPHLLLDNFFNPLALDRLIDSWPSEAELGLEVHDDGTYSKKKFRFGPTTPFAKLFLGALGEPVFLEALEKATGLEGLIPDPYYSGGGFHFTLTGGKLAIHADFNKHFKFKLDRRLNLLVYLNRDWREEYGGHLELWDRPMTHCVQRFLPIFNRMVIFSTTDFSYHGQPTPIACPPNMNRKSIALYYFTNGRPAEELSPHGEHSTLWKERPDQGY